MTLRPFPVTAHNSLSHDEVGMCSCRWSADQRTHHLQYRRVSRTAGRCADSARSSAAHESGRPAARTCQSSAATCDERGLRVNRRDVLLIGAAVAAAQNCAPAEASALPPAFDHVWESMGGGPSDLTFPANPFLGRWDVTSTLIRVDLPLGPDFVPDMQVVERARREDLDQPLKYPVRFVRNRQSSVVIDRQFNTVQLLDVYMGAAAVPSEAVVWDLDNPNDLHVSLPSGMDITTRVVRRSEQRLEDNRLDTSEYFRQIYEVPGRPEPKIKASQCFTKYKWRDDAAAALGGGVGIVATQVISDYLTAYDGEQKMMQTRGRPVVVYTYRMRFERAPDSGGAA